MTKHVRRRVLMLLENSSYIGDNRVSQEARSLTAAGYHVTVICPRKHQRPWRELVEGVQVYRFPCPPRGDGFLGYIVEYGYAMAAVFLFSLWVLAREGFDVVHAHCPPDSFALIAAVYKLMGKRYVFDHHDLAPEMYYYARFKNGGHPLVYKVLVGLEQLSCRLADRVIATNESYKAIEMDRGGVPEGRISVVRNGPDLKRIRPVEPDPDLQERASTILGFIGAMGPQDGLDYLLRALHHLVYDLDRTDVFCVIIGTGRVLEGLKSLAYELNVEDHVLFTGRIPDREMIRYLSTTHICVDPDPSNPFNDRCTMIKMMEYMALGKAIVAFDLPEHRVTAQDAAVYARPNDELDFARKIAALMDDPEQRQRMGAVGVARIKTELAWSHQEMHLLTAYETV